MWPLALVLLSFGSGRAGAEELIARGGGFTVHRVSYSVPAKPRDDAARNRGITDRGTTYGQNELFHAVQRSDGAEGVMWQEYGVNKVGKPIFLTWFSADKETAETRRITALDHDPWLAGACTIGNGNIVYMEIQDITVWISNELMAGSWEIPRSKECKAWMVEYNPTRGKEEWRKELDTQALDLFDFAEETANLRFDAARNQVGVTFSHRKRQAPDGLNHQQASYFVWDLATNTWMGWGSGSPGGHCFQGTMIKVSDGFLGAYFCDNSPRGIQLFSLQGSLSPQTFTVYSVKTRHGAGPQNPSKESFPKYNEISVDSKTFYKWSNDNQVYGEIAMPGAVEVDDGYIVFFSGEPPSLDNSVMQENEEVVQMPRNLGWVKVGKGLQHKQVLSPGPMETGGFYGYDGTWKDQQHRGINWLTDYKEKWLVMGKPKSVRLAPNRILLMWEVWHDRAYTEKDCERYALHVSSCKSIVTADWYDKTNNRLERLVRTMLMIVDDNVNVVKPVWAWDGGLVTPQGDAPQVIDGCAIIYVGRHNDPHNGQSCAMSDQGGSAECQIQRYKVCDSYDCAASSAKATDDPCFEPYPPAPYRCMDGVDTAGGTGVNGITTCPPGEGCRVAKCHEAAAHWCSTSATMRANCPKSCGICSVDQNEEPTTEYLETTAFLRNCEVGTKQYGLPPPCFDAGHAPFWQGGQPASCESAQDVCDRPAIGEDGKRDDTAQKMAESCARTCGKCDDSHPYPEFHPIENEGSCRSSELDYPPAGRGGIGGIGPDTSAAPTPAPTPRGPGASSSPTPAPPSNMGPVDTPSPTSNSGPGVGPAPTPAPTSSWSIHVGTSPTPAPAPAPGPPPPPPPSPDLGVGIVDGTGKAHLSELVLLSGLCMLYLAAA